MASGREMRAYQGGAAPAEADAKTIIGGKQKSGEGANLLPFPPASAEDMALFAKGEQFAAWQAGMQRQARKHFGGALASAIDWLLVDLLLRRESERHDTSVPDLRDALVKQKIKPPAAATLRKTFERFEADGLIRFKQKAGRLMLYEPTRKLYRQMGRLAASLPVLPKLDSKKSRQD